MFGSYRYLWLWLLCILNFLIHIHVPRAAYNGCILVLKSLLLLSHSTLFPLFIYELSINPNRKYNVVINNNVCLPPHIERVFKVTKWFSIDLSLVKPIYVVRVKWKDNKKNWKIFEFKFVFSLFLHLSRTKTKMEWQRHFTIIMRYMKL